VATLGYSRRPFVRAFRHERQTAWFDGLEGAFRHFDGVPQEVVFDNARALVDYHDAATREVRFNERLHAFARYWRFHPHACAPYRARTKGKDERGVGYVKRNAIAGHDFISWAALEGHLDWWMREIADQRVHGTTGEVPLARFQRDEAGALAPLNGRPPFGQMRELVRRVQADCAIAVDGNSYSVPWRLIGESVQVMVCGGQIRVSHAGQEVAVHAETAGRRQRIVDAAHFHGVAGVAPPVGGALPASTAPPPALLRPLAEYERAAGGGWS
ncbi:MAG TPA: IS21 family transposase, partial [Steroidobacteraceae bacterium]|nr:IS21 family transposase [Steroidobacteraceae bacterium]